MKDGGIGIGSASIILVFAVLCLSIFGIISFSSALADNALVKAEVQLVQNYYEADAQAESILAELLNADFIPEEIRGVEIISAWDWDTGDETVSFVCPISEKKELYVDLALREDDYDILAWRMRDIGGWAPDDEPLNLWSGDDEPWNLWPGDDEPLNLWPGD